jgi:hypothetical protein
MTDPRPASLFDPPPAAAALLERPPGWPAPPDRAAYHGLAGQLVDRIAPHTEADPVAILAQLLVAFGAAVGRGAWFEVEATRHHPNQFAILVGDSSKARKGSSWDRVWRLLERADPSLAGRLTTGLASGEGLVWHVRDPAGHDPGITDRRLLVIEPEFASVLKAANRDQSTLSPVLRSAWDGRPLALLTRTAPARATDAHISLIGHITQTELQHHARAVELANGFMNRFVLVACRRVRLLPDGGHPDPLAGSGLPARLARHLTRARRAGRLCLDELARQLWHHAYVRLSEPQPGVSGALAARAEAHTLRLALIYALIDGGTAITAAHLHAALALWDYSARSAAWTLDTVSGDPLAERIHAALTAHPDGLTRTQLHDLLARNRPADRIEHALTTLAASGRASARTIHTGGRPAQRWTATPSGSATDRPSSGAVNPFFARKGD